MTFYARVAKRPLHAPTQRHQVERLAGMQGVSVLHFLEVVAARKRYRRAKKVRLRSRERTLKKAGKWQPRKKQRVSEEWLYAGEGRFHELLKLAGMTIEDFSRLSGLSYDTVRAWYGFPMHGWAVHLLELVVWQKNAMVKLEHHGYPKDMFAAGKLPPVPEGKFPRTTAQGQAIIAAAMAAQGKE